MQRQPCRTGSRRFAARAMAKRLWSARSVMARVSCSLETPSTAQTLHAQSAQLVTGRCVPDLVSRQWDREIYCTHRLLHRRRVTWRPALAMHKSWCQQVGMHAGLYRVQQMPREWLYRLVARIRRHQLTAHRVCFGCARSRAAPVAAQCACRQALSLSLRALQSDVSLQRHRCPAEVCQAEG